MKLYNVEQIIVTEGGKTSTIVHYVAAESFNDALQQVQKELSSVVIEINVRELGDLTVATKELLKG